jgi:23S rRNA (cytidine1920-2'-O)/16S rRNA (cytidine1409-2'-O)-methyltransferase
MRLDQYLVCNCDIKSRNKATELIKSGQVLVDDNIIKKPSYTIDNQDIKITASKIYVSRAAWKLKYFLDEIKDRYSLDLTDALALDIGSSTGGFTEIMLEYGIKDKDIYCVDVGTKQLDISLKNRVNLFENTDIRDFHTDKRFDIITCDVSFISVVSIFKYIDFFAKDKIIVLFKPQFEVGRLVKRDKNGVVLDKDAISNSRDIFISSAKSMGWVELYSSISKISGKDGNIEELFYFEKPKI